MLGDKKTQHAWMKYAEQEDIPQDHEYEEVFKRGFVAGRLASQSDPGEATVLLGEDGKPYFSQELGKARWKG